MHNFDPYNVLLAIATNIPQRLKTAFVLQGYIGISHKKMLDGNAKMRINSNNVHKKNVCTQLSRINSYPVRKRA